MLGRPLLTGIFALALLFQTTCDALCLTSYCNEELSGAKLVAPNCHHSNDSSAPAGKSKECAHRKSIGAPAIQTKVSPLIASQELAVTPLQFTAVSFNRIEIRWSKMVGTLNKYRPPTLNLRI